MADLWQRYQEYLLEDPSLGFSLDISRMAFPDDFFSRMREPISGALAAMTELEVGAISNPDEGRMVGHYWLRAPELAPTQELRSEIEETLAAIKTFAAEVHSGAVSPAGFSKFRNVLLIGIGGSALGPQLMVDCLGTKEQPLTPYFLDNTDPDGMARLFSLLESELGQTLTVVTSKSGGTKETRNGMLAAQAAYEAAGLDFGKHAVAITGAGSELDKYAEGRGWIARFPMWDWVGGRTSILSAVGLLPAALLGYDLDGLLRGAREMDAATRNGDVRKNPAALLSLMWHYAGGGKGDKDMVVLPYRDRLGLFAKYLQQLVMESLGKELDLQGDKVNQGIVVYGNKGSTDQHAYVQQLREGANNFFAVFVETREDGESLSGSMDVEPGVTNGDYLLGFLLGTRSALWENGRESVTITLDALDAASLGKLIALFERAVGFYATLVGINAYHQPGVEAGKKAAQRVISLQGAVLKALQEAGSPLTAAEAASAAGGDADPETAYHVLRHLAANPGRGVTRVAGDGPAGDRFSAA